MKLVSSPGQLGDVKKTEHMKPTLLRPVSLADSSAAPRVCVAARIDAVYSQRFVRAHIERLPRDVLDVYSESFPFHSDLFDQLDRP